ncbi:outer membrane beta-barrel protein [uncultured Winogradskyella sp.]|uniref:outer membrane beta-barrel protein n=1 Tax=uncultured Winogradskyella sp. TaxID=395353 RepID=UPI0026146709|nr:outer membrane beta-barrel protein [uncultured Winogradskyella sp.]|tara:strand:- start:2022 stop:2888 length:867 start_codon:yes stop_codon:yes gene_type:complete
MKQFIIVLTALLLSTTSYAQFEISASGGYAIGSAGMKIGEIQTTSGTENTYGSYGEGLNAQLRGTYFFNDRFGADLSLGYLHGSDQTVSKVRFGGYEVDAIARARAFGASASLVYRFNTNVYSRIGALVKLGGKTEALVHQKSTFSQAEADAFGVPFGSYTETNYVEDYHGQFPLGFVAAIGYRHQLNTNFSIFVEAEYYGISLKRKDSEITEFNTNVVLPDGTVAVSGLYSLDNLPEGTNRTTTYVDELSSDNTDTSKELAVKVPYSSFGINFGVIYKFKRSHTDHQ